MSVINIRVSLIEHGFLLGYKASDKRSDIKFFKLFGVITKFIENLNRMLITIVLYKSHNKIYMIGIHIVSCVRENRGKSSTNDHETVSES